MSRLAALFRRDGRSVDPDELARMLAAQEHPGQVGVATWVSGAVGLGERLRPTTGPGQGTIAGLPGGDALAIAAEVRLDNRDELIAGLGLRGRESEIADAEIILHAYRAWGEGCSARLIGDFAFALWDGGRQTLFCARDPLGVRQLHYAANDHFCAVATSLPGVLALSAVSRRLDEGKVAEFLTPGPEDLARTFFRDIARLPAGHALVVTAERVRVAPYWSFAGQREVRYRRDEEYGEAFRALFGEAVRCRLRSVAPVGAMLSGGLDSSSVVCVARQERAADANELLPTFSLIFPQTPAADEREYAQAVIDGGGLEPHFVDGDAVSPLVGIDRLLALAGQPYWGPSLCLQWETYAAARRRGLGVLLDGTGGDQVVSFGLELLTELAMRGRWVALGREIAGLRRNFGFGAGYLLRGYAISPLIPEPLRRVRRRWQRGAMQQQATGFIAAPFAARLGERRQPAPGRRAARDRHAATLPQQLLRDVFDQAAATFGIEPRYPFLDRRVVEFCLGLPAEQKLARGMTRAIVRRALGDLLPPAVRDRTSKATPARSLMRNLLAHERERLDAAILGEPPPVVREYIDVDALRAAYLAYRERGAGEATWLEVARIWKTAVLAIWLRGDTFAW
ncbi:MAG: asparagine synthase-related protein [Chloroflexia bacterium]